MSSVNSFTRNSAQEGYAVPGVVTGKPIEIGGSLGRFDSTGRGVVYCIIEAAKRAVLAQTDLLHREFGRAKSLWKADGTRVTPVDIAISEAIVLELSTQFPDDQFFSEELTHEDGPIALTNACRKTGTK